MTDPDSAARLIKSGMTVATSGFSKLGYPKVVPRALARLGGEGPTDLTLITSGAVGEAMEEWIECGGVSRLLPYQSSKILRRLANEGLLAYSDHHLGHVADWVEHAHWATPDIALIEVGGIGPEGGLIPGLTLGNIPIYADRARQIILEVNHSGDKLDGIHDVFRVTSSASPKCIPIFGVNDRIGTPHVRIDLDKVIAVVTSHEVDEGYQFIQPTREITAIAYHVSEFVRSMRDHGEIPPTYPVQVGVGNLGNAVLQQLWRNLSPLRVYSEVVHDTVLDGLDEGGIQAVSTGALALSAAGQKELDLRIQRYRKSLVIRPQNITNHPEVIRRLGVVGINSVVEVDIYGHANSSAVAGSHVLNGIGGSGDFTRNALLSIVALPSTRDQGRISSIVPMVSHVDHTEHDIHVIVTEHGVADLRGKSPRERAHLLIENCADERFRGVLRSYFKRACQRGGQWPHLLSEALSWHIRYEQTGDMLS